MSNLAVEQSRSDIEPKPIIPAMAGFYGLTRELYYPFIRLVLGGLMLFHAFISGKLTGGVTVAGFAANLAQRGMEPALPLAYMVFCTETVGAVFLIIGFLTRIAAGAIAIELAVITFAVYWPNGFRFTSPGAGAEFTFLWGLMVFAVALRGGGPYSVDRWLGREV